MRQFWGQKSANIGSWIRQFNDVMTGGRKALANQGEAERVLDCDWLLLGISCCVILLFYVLYVLFFFF